MPHLSAARRPGGTQDGAPSPVSNQDLPSLPLEEDDRDPLGERSAQSLSAAPNRHMAVNDLLHQLGCAYHSLIGENEALRREIQVLKLCSNVLHADASRADESDCPVGSVVTKATSECQSSMGRITSLEPASQRRERSGSSLDALPETRSTHSLAPVWQQRSEPGSHHKLTSLTMESFSIEAQMDPVETSDACCQNLVSYPGNPSRLAWDTVGLVLILYDLINIPLQAFDFPETAFTDFMDWASLLFWTTNMPLSVFVGYVHKGITIMDPRKILRRYIRTWFLLDMAVLVPGWYMVIQSLAMDGDSQRSASVVKLLRVLRLSKCMRLVRAGRVKHLARQISDLIDSEYTGTLFNIFKMFCALLIVTHYIAAMWYLVGTYDESNSWILSSTYDMDDALTRYIVSFQWCLTQFTPASKVPVNPQNNLERAYAVCVVIFALVGFAYILGSISTYIAYLRAMAEDADRQFFEVRRFLRKHKVSPVLGARIVRFLEHAYQKSKEKKDGSSVRIFSLLSDELRSELRVEMTLPLLTIHPLFARLSLDLKPTLMRLASCLKKITLACEEVLFFEDEKATHMYFLECGCLKYATKAKSALDHHQAEHLKEKTGWITEQALWAGSWVHKGRAAAMKESDLSAVAPEDFSRVVVLNPAAFELVVVYARAFVAWLNVDDRSWSDIYRRDELSGVLGKFLDHADARLQQSFNSERGTSTFALASFLKFEGLRRSSGAL